jgi:glucosylceramidase
LAFQDARLISLIVYRQTVHMKPRVATFISLVVALALLGPGQAMPLDAGSTSPAVHRVGVLSNVATQNLQADGSQPVEVWLTTGDASIKLQQQLSISFHAGTGSNSRRVVVDESLQYQQMDGFGAAITDSSAWVIYNLLSPDQRNALMNSLFSPSSGIGLSYVRLPMGASDFSLGPYTYDDIPADQTDPNLDFFSIAHDRPYIIPVIRQAQGINPQLKFMASPWSAPAWMKVSKSLNGSTLLSSNYQTYANYFVKFIQAYQAEDIPLHAVTVQNEPYYASPTYPTMVMKSREQAAFVKGYLGPTFVSAGVNTKILVWDHNWGAFDMALDILDDNGAIPFIAGSAWHCYDGTPDLQTLVHIAHPDKDIYFTECSGGGNNPFADDLAGTMRIVVIGAIRNWAKTVVLWNLALDENHGPRIGGCDSCRGLVTIHSASGAVNHEVEYYVLGHLAKFVPPGAYRIASDANTNAIENVAFVNPDGSKVLVVLNPGQDPTTFDVRWNDQYFSYTLPAQSVATFKWGGLATITGRVTSSNGSAVPGVTLWANSSLSATTDITGNYGFTDLVSGTYTLTPSQVSYVFLPSSRTVMVPPDSVKQDFVMLPGPVSITLSLSDTASLPANLVYYDTQGLTTTLEFPPGAVTGVTTVWLWPTLASNRPGFVFAGHAFELGTFQAGTLWPGLTFSAPVAVTLHYSDDDVQVAADESQLVLSWWTGSEWQDAAQTCDPASSYIRDVVNKTLSVSICRGGLFALFGPIHQVFLPVVIRGN